MNNRSKLQFTNYPQILLSRDNSTLNAESIAREKESGGYHKLFLAGMNNYQPRKDQLESFRERRLLAERGLN